MAANYGNELDFWADLNGQDPETYVRTQRDINTSNGKQAATDKLNNAIRRYESTRPGDPENAQAKADIDAAYAEQQGYQATQNYQPYNDLAYDQRDQSQAAVDALHPYTQAIGQQRQANATNASQWQGAQSQAFNNVTNSNNGWVNSVASAQGAADSASDAAMGRYGSALDSANNTAASGYGALQDAYGNYGILQANPYQGDAQSNAADVARQQASYDTLGGWASGANNISSDAGLVGQQQDIYGQFNDWASGGHDISSDPGLVGMQQGVYDDYGQFASGAMDLESQAATAAADPEAVAAQKEALGEFRDRMDPKLTDSERFLYMQSRLAQEQSQRAVRDANYRELERRGMGGSTMALSNLNASSAEASNTRALQDLGANAKAVDRAEKALVNYGNMSSTMREQSFSEDFATKSAADRMAVNNNQQRLAGIAGQGQMATAMRNADDDIKKFNSTQQMQGLQGAGMMANTMRGQDDAMRQGNANRQLAGAQSQGEMATSMRNAGDAMNMFNKEQQGIQLRHEDDFNAGQQRDAWTRDAGMFDASQSYANGLAGREGDYAKTGITAADQKFERAASTAGTAMTANRDYTQGFDNLAEGARTDRRDAMTGLGAESDAAYREQDLAQRGNADVNATRRNIIDQQGEDRRAGEASASARALQDDQQRYEQRNRSVFDQIF